VSERSHVVTVLLIVQDTIKESNITWH